MVYIVLYCISDKLLHTFEYMGALYVYGLVDIVWYLVRLYAIKLDCID
jgi:hypothetical protein